MKIPASFMLPQVPLLTVATGMATNLAPSALPARAIANTNPIIAHSPSTSLIRNAFFRAGGEGDVTSGRELSEGGKGVDSGNGDTGRGARGARKAEIRLPAELRDEIEAVEKRIFYKPPKKISMNLFKSLLARLLQGGGGEIGSAIAGQIALFGSDLLGVPGIARKTVNYLFGDYVGGCTGSFGVYFVLYGQRYRWGIGNILTSRDIPIEDVKEINVVLNGLKNGDVSLSQDAAFEKAIAVVKAMELPKSEAYLLEDGVSYDEIAFEKDAASLKGLYVKAVEHAFASPRFECFVQKSGKPRYLVAVRDMAAFMAMGVAPTGITYMVQGPLAYWLMNLEVNNVAVGVIGTVTSFFIFNLSYFPFFEYVRTGKMWNHLDKAKWFFAGVFDRFRK